MQTYPCQCGKTLFFENVVCSFCNTPCGWCDSCQRVVSATEVEGQLQCGGANCGAQVQFCSNREKWNACNSLTKVDSPLCLRCDTTTAIPDLSIATNLEQWKAIEAAKRLLLYDLDLIEFDWRSSSPPLDFRFLADVGNAHVITGHDNGVITLNLREANPVAREKARQKFNEPQRTLIGHFRHEAAHYLWQVLVEGSPKKLAEFTKLFGDHTNPDYTQAMPNYYENGPPANWQQNYISRYAASHPWEDFAETAAFYLDMRSVMDTVAHQLPSLELDPSPAELEPFLANYLRFGIAFNEVNRSMGLIDVVPEIVNPPVKQKLLFVHHLLRGD